MQTKMIEATNGFNWGKFMIGRFTMDELAYRSAIGSGSLLHAVGWTPDVLLVCDLQTGEAAIFRPFGSAKADLEKHKIWVCPMCEPFLIWLYQQDLTNLDDLPATVELKDAPSALYGHRQVGIHPFSSTPDHGACAACGKRRTDAIHKEPAQGW